MAAQLSNIVSFRMKCAITVFFLSTALSGMFDTMFVSLVGGGLFGA
jgi:hypothetical protein